MDRYGLPSRPSLSSTVPAQSYDVGLRRHMLGIYRNMGLGLGITGAVALGVASTPAVYEPIFNTPSNG